MHIEHILETHNHADHVSGHGRLAAATGATIHVHRDAQPDYDHEPFDDGWELELGSVTVRAIHTPGHRPEHTAFALIDTARGPEPWAVLTGDTLFVGDIARPDLAVDKEEGARGIFHSLHDQLLTLAGQLRGLARPPRRLALRRPRHGPEGVVDDRLRARPTASCSGSPTRTSSSAARSPALGPQPPNFKNIVALNRGPLVVEGVDAHPLTPRQVEQASDAGALIVDVRTELQFDEAHVPALGEHHGAAGRASARSSRGSPSADQRVVLVGRDDEDARHAAAPGRRRSA